MLGGLNELIYGKHQISVWHIVNAIQVLAAFSKLVARYFYNIPVWTV